MSIDSPLFPLPDPGTELEVEVPAEPTLDSEGASVIEMEDGGITIDFDPSELIPNESDHGSNLAELLEESTLRQVGSDLINQYEADEQSRAEWKDTYTKGMDLLGLSIEERTKPWDGACGISHPLLSEAVVRFQSQTIGELFPASGPTRAKIVGKATPERVSQANRVADFMNYLLLEEMEEYREEVDKMLFCLPLAGSAFKKTYWDAECQRPASMFVPPEDFVVEYGTSSIDSCERATHVMRKTENWIRDRQVSGFYRDIEIGNPSIGLDEIDDKKQELTGEQPTTSSDSRRTLLEMHVTMDLPGFEAPNALPYVITIDKMSGDVLSIYRNWKRDADPIKKREYFSHYQYVPGLGFYGFGLIHLIGGIVLGATSILRQLVDAGSLANLPGGFRAKNLRIAGGQDPIAPGEWRDVDVLSGSIRDGLYPLPYKEPSAVLHALLGDVVEEGRRFASLTDINVSNMNQESPVGTTLALLERNLKVMTAIAARCHNSMKRELKILSGIVKEQYQDYPYETEEGSLQEDFDDRVDIIPVSDPNSSTMAQRIMQYQAAFQMSQSHPTIYRHEKLHRQMLDVLAIQDAHEIVPTEEDLKPMDPITENQKILNLDPVKAFPHQDHQAHIQVHMMGMQDPKIQQVLQDSPGAQQSAAALMAHVTDHLGYEYRRQIEANLGTSLPHPDEPLPPEMEVELSRLVAQAADKLFRRNQLDVSQAEAQAQAEDPVFQMNKRELEMKEAKTLSDMEMQQQRLSLEIEKLKLKAATDRARLDQQRESDAERVQGELMGQLLRAASATEELSTQEKLKMMDAMIERVKQEGENARAEAQARVEFEKIDADMFSKLGVGMAEPPSERRVEVGNQSNSNSEE